MNEMKRVVGYCTPWSVASGQTIEFKVSTYNADQYDARLVRVICGDDRPEGPGFMDQMIDAPFAGLHAGRRQTNPVGSHIAVPYRPVLDKAASLTVQTFIYPTTPRNGKIQGLIARGCTSGNAGFWLFIDAEGHLAFTLRDGAEAEATVTATAPLLDRKWYRVAGTFDGSTGILRLYQQPLEPNVVLTDTCVAETRTAIHKICPTDSPLLMAALPSSEKAAYYFACFNGKLDRPRIFSRALTAEQIADASHGRVAESLSRDVIGIWDFAQEIGTDRVVDLSPHGLEGRVVNLPSRAVKGHNWTAEWHDWRVVPDQYAAIHFHDDDLYDAGWETDFAFTIPECMKSGFYAVRLSALGDVSYVSFYVRPRRGTSTQPVALLASTLTYMAYANMHYLTHHPLSEVRRNLAAALNAEEAFMQEHAELGLSAYDTHSDGSGVRFSSRLRPVLDVAPLARIWNYNADTHITDWLSATGQEFDVITDEDVHTEGSGLLSHYRVVMTGTHPEYWTTPMLEATKAYLAHGGRLMYLGGNGFYWRCAVSAAFPGAIEVRRSEGGARYWAEEPGEYHLAFSGEYGGLWRRAGTPPQAVVGIGTRATGFDRSSYYRQTEARNDPRVAFMFEGIDAEELIGNFGSVGGGASGLEIDASDRELGTPHHALVVAVSEEHSDETYLAPEEILILNPTIRGSENPRVCADIVFFETANGGAVFSVGSIAWAGSLAHNDYANNVARLTHNVLTRFLADQKF
jgi:N,N-dimethylformamidase